MYADETPILESVFVDLAPNAVCIADVADGILATWYWIPLSYQELLEWTDELADETAA